MISIMVMIQNSNHQEISKIKSLGLVIWNTLETMIAILAVAVLTTATIVSTVRLVNHKK